MFNINVTYSSPGQSAYVSSANDVVAFESYCCSCMANTNNSKFLIEVFISRVFYLSENKFLNYLSYCKMEIYQFALVNYALQPTALIVSKLVFSFRDLEFVCFILLFIVFFICRKRRLCCMDKRLQIIILKIVTPNCKQKA